MEFIVQKGFKHILVDFPSVDREEDEGRLLAHRAFWKGKGQNLHYYGISLRSRGLPRWRQYIVFAFSTIGS